jgi:hypothetical protein
MRPGMSVRLEVIRRSWDDVSLVPRASLELSDDDRAVLHLQGGETIDVVLMGCGAAECALSEGPSPGTQLGRAP